MVGTLARARHRTGMLVTAIAGIAGVGLLFLLGLNVVSRQLGINLVWIAESARIVFVWGMAIGMIAVSLRGAHFSVDIFNLSAVEEGEPSDWRELPIQLLACGVLAYILYYAIPSIARASTQVFAAVPLTYGTMRLALSVALGGMLVAHLWRFAEVVLMRFTKSGSSPAGQH
jgi:TRAP-type C4-dicarboxylate transport system permease small subunit